MTIEPCPSLLFKQEQNADLAQAAVTMSRTFADREFLRWSTRTDDPSAAWSTHYSGTQKMARMVLDGLLASRPPEDQESVKELAASVEAFVLPSFATESIVFKNPGKARGHLIGLAPLVIDLATEIAWLVPRGYPPAYRLRPSRQLRHLEPAAGRLTSHLRDELDEVVVSYLISAFPPGTGRPEAPTSSFRAYGQHEDIYLARARREGLAPVFGPMARWNASIVFCLAHEIAHIEADHLSLPPSGRAPEWLQSLPDDERWEIEADCATVTSILNYFLWQWGMENDPPRIWRLMKRARQNYGFKRTVIHGMRLANGACESFYAAMDILAEFAKVRGDQSFADRILAVMARRSVARAYIAWILSESMTPHYSMGLHLLLEEENNDHGKIDLFLAHIKQDVLPHISG